MQACVIGKGWIDRYIIGFLFIKYAGFFSCQNIPILSFVYAFVCVNRINLLTNPSCSTQLEAQSSYSRMQAWGIKEIINF